MTGSGRGSPRHYLMGVRTPMKDLMAWNADATQMAFRMHAEYLRQLFLNNDLAEDRFLVDAYPHHGWSRCRYRGWSRQPEGRLSRSREIRQRSLSGCRHLDQDRTSLRGPVVTGMGPVACRPRRPAERPAGDGSPGPRLSCPGRGSRRLYSSGLIRSVRSPRQSCLFAGKRHRSTSPRPANQPATCGSVSVIVRSPEKQ